LLPIEKATFVGGFFYLLRLRRVAHMGYGGILMLEYQKSSAATPHVHNALGVRCWCDINLLWCTCQFRVTRSRQSQKRLRATRQAKQRRTQTSWRDLGQVTISVAPALGTCPKSLSEASSAQPELKKKAKT
jgi:hypothetical protein